MRTALLVSFLPREGMHANPTDPFLSAVMPSTKRGVVQVIRHDFGCVVGMTGDGVNDAPALSFAQVGEAVEGDTDAAKNAAAITLTDPGLSPIFGAVCTSREIFPKVKSCVENSI